MILLVTKGREDMNVMLTGLLLVVQTSVEIYYNFKLFLKLVKYFNALKVLSEGMNRMILDEYHTIHY
jgi:hypothetical protein